MTGPNKSHAVMAQRSEPHDSLDDFPTPPWATRALVEYVIGPQLAQRQSVWEPACNRGHMLLPLAEYFPVVYASDVHDYGCGFEVRDFLWPGPPRSVDWVITNPPFRLADQFIKQAFEIAGAGVAVLVRTQFLESVGRYVDLFKERPPDHIAQFVERVPIRKGRLDPTMSTATAYCWCVWLLGDDTGEGTQFEWIPPCRKRLEDKGDYE